MKYQLFRFRFFLSIITIFFIPVFSFSQIFVPFDNVDKTMPTGYGADTIFIFYSDHPEKKLSAEHSSREKANFTWSVFNKETEQYDLLFTHHDTATSSISLDSLYDDGRLNKAMEALNVEITDEEDSTEYYRAWTLVDTFPDFGDIWVESNECQKLWLAVEKFTLNNYEYYQLDDSSYSSLTLNNERKVSWESSEDVDIYSADVLIDYGDMFVGKIGAMAGIEGQLEYFGPYEDSDYYLSVENSFGNSRSDTIFNVPAKAVNADFKIYKIEMDGNEANYDKSEINEAPLQIRLENQSKNSDDSYWIGYEDSTSILKGAPKILWENMQENPSIDSIPKYRPGKYPVKLIADNEYECVDSMTYYHVSVDSSRIDSAMIPNVFTPNGDGSNDVFVLPKRTNVSGSGSRGIVSIERLEVTILNRNGELVYKYEGHPDDWEGWDGKVKNSNRDAKEGTYLYVIKGHGYDGVSHESKEFTGFLYLFR
ncbi:MAG: gliding motility-associated C-terminal domain-containing protein [Bacteroidota bacterium]